MSSPDRPIFNDRYEIRSRIGRGGMADVYLGHDLLLDRPVAVKVLFPEYATDPSFVERFRREAQSAANLTHPNIVGVYDWGRQGSTYFIVMEYVQGRTLSDIIRTEGPLQPLRAVEVANEVAAALGFAHRNGVVHRDVKPGNILVSTSGTVKVADFGIARALNSSNEQDLTQAGAVMGTATYFSPEQAQGSNPDPRSDLYSLGIVMYEIVAGRPPFSGENPVAIAYKQVHDTPPPLSQMRPDVPRGYDAIVNKLLMKKAVDRYQTADELRADLKRFREGQPVAALGAIGAAGAAVAVRAAQPTQVARPVQPIPATARTSMQPASYEEFGPDHRGRGALYAVGAVLVLALLALAGWFAWRAINGDDAPSATTVVVPDFRGQTLENARTQAQDLGLTVDEEPVLNETVEKNVVWQQQPAPDTEVAAGDQVILVYNPGKGTVQLPNLVGQSQQAAEATLSSLGLPAEVLELESDRPAGIVIEQNPPAGEVEAGTTVTLTVSLGAGSVAVPNVVGLNQVDAAAQLAKAGFVVKTVQEANDTVPAGIVLRTDPPANSQLDNGATVTMVVSSGPAPITVPNVEGLTESQARDTLQTAGFLQSVKYQDVPFNSDQAGRVISQSPAAGTKLPKNSPVTINVGRALPPPTTTTLPPTTPPSTAAPTTASTTAASTSTSTSGP
jgi:serine/threonine-protein kinase